MKVAGVYIRRRESRAVVYSDRGEQIYRSVGDGANYHRAKKEGIVDVVSSLLKDKESMDCICMGVAGCDRDKDISELLVEMNLHFRDCIAYNNGVIALVGASGKALGSEDIVHVEADTGSIAVGVNRNAEILRVGGWGYMIGDEGGAFDIGRKALMHAARAQDGVEENDLAEEITDFLSLQGFSDIIDLYNERDPVRYVAELFPMVCRSRSELAGRILDEGAAALAALVESLSSRLDMRDGKILYETGRVFDDPGYKSRFERRLKSFTIGQPKHSPEVGAAMLAMERLTGNFVEME